MRVAILTRFNYPSKPTNLVAMAQRRPNSSSSGGGKSKAPAVPAPSASVVLVSPTNQILLLHRVKGSSAFPSAYVFAGGNLSAKQDGDIPTQDDPSRHVDSEIYRRAAIRETFEESGILLAKRHKDDEHLINVRNSKRERIRKQTHANEIKLVDWIKEIGAELDTGALLPFTRWITPPNVPKRFTTQMYIYFMPLDEDSDVQAAGTQIPASDGGIEHTAAEFDYAQNWMSMANSRLYPRESTKSAKDIIMFPPQFFLLHLLAPFLPAPKGKSFTKAELAKQRDDVREFLKTSDPPWGEKCISPTPFGVADDGRSILDLYKPGPAELIKEGRKGEYERVVLTSFTKAGPRDVEVRWRSEMAEALKAKSDPKSKI